MKLHIYDSDLIRLLCDRIRDTDCADTLGHFAEQILGLEPACARYDPDTECWTLDTGADGLELMGITDTELRRYDMKERA